MDKIRIIDLNVYYGDFQALKDINMDIGVNEITAFIGPSGCGKSTLLKCLNRMNDLAEGCRVIAVSDSGFGIPAEHQCRVFERFYRIDKSHSRETGGTGLGLSIVKHGAEFHNAKIRLLSRPGRGTTITVTFKRS